MKKIFLYFLFLFFLYLSLSAQDYWQQTNGPYGGFIKAIAVSPNGDIYAGTCGPGYFGDYDIQDGGDRNRCLSING
jgi:hypothetical protein